jgi:hypothetical protein
VLGSWRWTYAEWRIRHDARADLRQLLTTYPQAAAGLLRRVQCGHIHGELMTHCIKGWVAALTSDPTLVEAMRADLRRFHVSRPSPIELFVFRVELGDKPATDWRLRYVQRWIEEWQTERACSRDTAGGLGRWRDAPAPVPLLYESPTSHRVRQELAFQLFAESRERAHALRG